VIFAVSFAVAVADLRAGETGSSRPGFLLSVKVSG